VKPISIFGEPPDGVDETWTRGAMLGGMMGYEPLEIADSYFRAGEILVETVLDRRRCGTEFVEARDVIHPIMFTYRHGLELYLKAILRTAPKTHNLGSLLEGFCRHVRERYLESVPSWFTKPVSEFITYDPTSVTFRYESTNSQLARDGEFWVDLATLQVTMERLRLVLRRVFRSDQWGERAFPEYSRITPRDA